MARRRANPDSGAAATVQRVLNETKEGFDAHGVRTSGYDRCYEIWRSPHNPREREGRPKWKPLLKAKYAMQSIDQATVAIAQGVPAPKCSPRNQASVEKAKAMEQLLTYYADVAHVADQQSPVIQQALVYGVSPAKTSWCYKEADRGMLVPAVDENDQVLWQPSRQRIVEADWPEMQAWDVYDCWWDPFAKDPDTAAYVVLRCWPSKDELEKRAYDEETSPYGMYRNLDLLFAAGPGAERPTTAQNQILDGQPATYRDRFEVWEIWRDDRLTVLGNRQILLYDGPKPYWMPGKPVSISVARPDFFRMEGISETEIIDDIQQNLQAQDNLRLENMRFTVNRGATVRQTVPDRAGLVVQPHFLWFVDDHDDVRFVDQPPLPSEAYAEHETLLSLLQLQTGVNAYVTGASSSGAGVDQTTATGVSLLSSSASRLLVYKAELISRRTWLRTFQQWADLTRQFLRSSVEIPVRGPGAEIVEWTKAGPGEVYGDYDVRIEAAEESLNKQTRRADLIALSNSLAPYVQAGIVDPRALLKELAEAFGFSHPEALFPPLGQQQIAAPNGNNGGTFPTGSPPLVAGGVGGAQQLVGHPLASILKGNQ